MRKVNTNKSLYQFLTKRLSKSLSKGSQIINSLVTITNIAVATLTSSSFGISALITQQSPAAVVTIEYGPTTEYGFEIECNESPINGEQLVTAELNL